MRGRFFLTRVSAVILLILPILTLGAAPSQAQHLKAFLGVGAPDISDGVFEGNYHDIVTGSGEWGNYLLLDFVSDNPSLTVDGFTLDFNPSVDATIVGVYPWGHHDDGAMFLTGSLVDDVYSATVSGLGDAVDVFIIHFDFDKVSLGTGTPLGADYIGATLEATLSDGTVLSGAFDMGDVLTAFAQIGVPSAPVDLWARDCEADDGNAPSDALCPHWWTSPDIFIDNDFDSRLNAPVYGEDNILRGVVRNRDTGFARDVTVDFYYRNNTTGLVFPSDAMHIGQATVNVPPGGVAPVWVVWEDLEPPPASGHWCVGMVLTHPGDPLLSPIGPPYRDNNIACANIWFIAGRAGEYVVVTFSAATGGKSKLGLEPWPRDFRLEVEQTLPRGWAWELAGATPDELFTLREAEERPVTVRVRIPADAEPHAGGQLAVQQVDAQTGAVVGGVDYRLYEDHLPPTSVDAVEALAGPSGVRLSWEPIRAEAESGLEERVAYYEVLRNREILAKVLRDEDPLSFGMQWTDAHAVGERITYAVRVVDEGGNVSAESPTVTVRLPREKGWCVWVVVILVIVIIVMITLMARRPRPRS
ncbi:MAG: hypothetical protein JW819_00915 [Candidatus Krumholzibacteriota bacterium]|nr:hypothetical protein [Candidatus Krumholzibacteriota bacterium]